jgi:hypothetical protein
MRKEREAMRGEGNLPKASELAGVALHGGFLGAGVRVHCKKNLFVISFSKEPSTCTMTGFGLYHIYFILLYRHEFLIERRNT